MSNYFFYSISILLALLGRPQSAAACVQDTASIAVLDTTWQFKPTKPITESQPFYKNKLFCASIVPAILITYGASTINSHGIYSSYAARADVQRTFNTTRTRIDDYLQFAPYLEIGAVLVAGVNSRDDRLNLGLVVLKSELIMLSSVYLVKTLTGLERPDESARNSFPSGHTAQAFLAATIVHTEFRDKSQWYGVGAYAMASTVGVCRMINNKHWQSDVVAGAGFGILSAHLAYLSHRSRWGRKPIGRDVGVLPLWSPAGGTGLSLTWQPK